MLIGLYVDNCVAVQIEYSLRVFRFWGDQVGRRDKCFDSVYKGIIYQIAINYRQLKRKEKKDFFKSGKHNSKEPEMPQTKVKKKLQSSTLVHSFCLIFSQQFNFLISSGNSYTAQWHGLYTIQVRPLWNVLTVADYKSFQGRSRVKQ